MCKLTEDEYKYINDRMGYKINPNEYEDQYLQGLLYMYNPDGSLVLFSERLIEAEHNKQIRLLQDALDL